MFDLDELEEQARALLPSGVYEYVAAGADNEITSADNVAAWQRIRLRPRVLRDVSTLDTQTTLLGTKVPTPVIVAPSGRHMLVHPEGELGTARGAALAGSVMVVSCFATVSLEEVAASVPEALLWFQLSFSEDRSETKELVDRAVSSGYRALVLTVDVPVPGRSLRAARNPITLPDDTRLVNFPSKPPALSAWDQPFSEVVPNAQGLDDLAWLVEHAKVPVIVKGVLRPDDAVACVEAGAVGVIVSNHGGRHLDHAIASVGALGEVVTAVGDRAEVFVDGGIRRGTDVLKAIALGASAVLIGRPPLWGLATAGSEGVRMVLDHLREELSRSMALCGAAKLDEITSDLLVLDTLR